MVPCPLGDDRTSKPDSTVADPQRQENEEEEASFMHGSREAPPPTTDTSSSARQASPPRTRNSIPDATAARLPRLLIVGRERARGPTVSMGQSKG